MDLARDADVASATGATGAGAGIGWLGGGVLDLARRGEAESRDATLAAVVRKGLDPLFGLDPAFCFGWSLGGGVLDLARRGDAESRDTMLAGAA